MGHVAGSEFDHRDFDRLFEAHYAELERFARRRLADRAALEDVLADTFATAWRRRADMPDPALPWLYGVCARVIGTSRRAQARRSRLRWRLGSQPVDRSRDPAEVHAERSEIETAFARLSEGQREVLRLIAWDGLTTAEAAAVLDCSPGAFRTRFHRARRELEKHLASAGNERMNAPNQTAASEAR
jgi:RNA polymerase sigma-70 factor (ECF subfamily)